jgi:DNA-damage-inducible protein J
MSIRYEVIGRPGVRTELPGTALGKILQQGETPAAEIRDAEVAHNSSVHQNAQLGPSLQERQPIRARDGEIQCISGSGIMATTMVHVRLDEKTKRRAAKTLAGMGISVSDAVRMLLVRVAAEKALPFEVRVPNATTVKAMRAADKGKGKRLKSAGALFKDLGI